MDTTDKQTPQSVTLTPVEEKEIEKIFIRHLGYKNPTSIQDHIEFRGFWLQEHIMKAGREIVERERQRLRDAVTNYITDNNKKIAAAGHLQKDQPHTYSQIKLVNVVTNDACRWFLSLLEIGSGKEETTDKVKEVKP